MTRLGAVVGGDSHPSVARLVPALIWAGVLVFGIAFAIDPLHSLSVDLAHHGALVARLLYDGHVTAGDPSLGEMASYPRGAHATAALAGRVAGSAITGMQWIAVGSVATVWAALAAGLLLLEGRARAIAVAYAIAAVLLARLSGIELFGSELVGNYHFAQLVAYAVCVAAIVVSASLERHGVRPLVLRFGTALVGCVLVDVHLLPALQLLGATAVLGLVDVRRAWGARPLRTAAPLASLFVAAAAYVLLHPVLRAMQEIASNNGAVQLRLVGDFTELGVLLGVAGCVSVLTLHKGMQAGSGGEAAPLRHLGALGVSTTALCLLQRVAWGAFDAGSPYAVYKYVPALQTFVLVNAALLLAVTLQRSLRPGHTPRGAGCAGAAAMLPLIALHALHGEAPTTSAAWSTSERDARELALELPRDAIGRHAYVHGIEGISAVGDYFLTIAAFRAPRDQRALEVLTGHKPAGTGWLVGEAGTLGKVRETCVRGMGNLVAVDLVCND